MPGFKVHITASTALGVGYGIGAYTLYGVPLPTAALATTLCSVSGMLPDLDSGPGRPLHESISFAAAAVPMMMVDRFRHLGWTHESMILAGAGIYLFIRFGLGHMLKKWTVHRGIFHSFPVALLFTEIAFLVCTSGDLHMRYFKAGAITIGFLSHLILDEIWSIDFRHGKLKSSFGTALKFWAPCWWANGLAYAITAGATLLSLNDPVWTQAGGQGEELHEMATSILKDFAINRGTSDPAAQTAQQRPSPRRVKPIKRRQPPINRRIRARLPRGLSSKRQAMVKAATARTLRPVMATQATVIHNRSALLAPLRRSRALMLRSVETTTTAGVNRSTWLRSRRARPLMACAPLLLGLQPHSAVSSSSVTGPSLIKATCIIWRKRPVATDSPRSRSAATKRSYKASAISGGAAAA